MSWLFLAAYINIDITYVILNITLLVIFIIAGFNVSKGHSYWENALLCTFAFVLVLGSRYLRGNDYTHYLYIYTHGGVKHELLFTLLNTVLREWIGLNKYLIFYIYAIPFILSGFKFLKNFRSYAHWIFPLFLVSMIYFEEYEIRQALGFTFVFLFVDEFINKRHHKTKRILYCSIYAILTLGFHSANIMFLFLFIVCYLMLKRIIPYFVTIPLLFFASYFFPDLYDISYLKPILNLLASSGNEKFEQYAQGNAAEAWFGESAFQFSNERNPLVKFLDFLANSALFYFSAQILNSKKVKSPMVVLTMTNLYIIGDIAKQAFLYLEILNRMGGLFQRMWFIPFAVVMVTVRVSKLNILEKWAYCLMFFVFYDYTKYLFAPTQGMTKFLWDI